MRWLVAAFVAAFVAACGGPVIVPPPVQIDGVVVEYREGHFDGPALGGATWIDGVPVVFLEDLSDAKPGVQWFIWAHEVCHNRHHGAETAADCCAGVWFSELRIPPWDATEHLLTRSHTDDEHPPGAVRSAVFLSCWSLKSD